MGVNVVRSGKFESLLSLCNVACNPCSASSIGMLVNSDSTSKDIITSSASMVCLLMMFANSPEFLTVKFELPIKEDKILTKKPDRS